MISIQEFKNAAMRLGLQEIENHVAAVVRGYDQLKPDEWQEVENVGLRLSLDAATLDLNHLPRPDGISDLTLSLLGRTLGNSTREADYSTGYLSAISAFIFGAAGNFPTAGVVARTVCNLPENGPFEAWAMSVLADKSMQLVRDEMPDIMRPYCHAERRAIIEGSEEHFKAADMAFEACIPECIKKFPHSDGLLLLLWTQVRQRMKELSVARILQINQGFKRLYVRALLRTSSPLLYPTQALAIEKYRVLDPHENSLVLLPTSTGKSLLGELAIVAALSDERPLGVYLAPYRALTDQIFRRMKARLARIHVDAQVRRGGYLTERPITGDSHMVLVATPESFDAFLRARPELLDRIACCVFDEFHLIEQPVRGLRYEALVGRLREKVVENDSIKIVALSPVVSPTPTLVEWLGVVEETTVKSGWKPTARRLAIAGPDSKVRYYTPGDHLQTPEKPAVPMWSGRVTFPHALFRAPNTTFAHLLREHDRQVASNVAAVGIDQYNRFELPVMILATTRDQTREIASIVAHSLPEVDEEHPSKTFSTNLAQRYPYLFTLRTCLRHGVAYHNASLPSWVRERLERLMEKRDLKIVTATTTLAEGVDLPFRVVVMAEWQRWLFGQKRPIPTLLFRNIAGRCGRAGAFTEGDTVIVDNPGRQQSSSSYNDRIKKYFRLYVRPPEIQLRSAIADAVEAGATTYLKEMDAAIESQFLAFIDARSLEEGHEEEAFVSSLYASRFPNALNYVINTVNKFSTDMLSVRDYPVLLRNSPFELTDFGKTVLVTGLSPRSGIALAEFLRDYDPPLEPGKGRQVRNRHAIQWIPVITAFRDAIAEDNSFITELQSGSFHRVGQHGFPVNKEIFNTVLLAWLSGLPIEEITFLAIRNRDLKTSAKDWLTNLMGSPPKEFEYQIEQVAVFLNIYVAQQWGWVLRGTAAIAKHIGDLDQIELEQLAARIEHGVHFFESVALLRQGCSVDRAKLDKIVGLYLGKQETGEFDEDSLMDWVRKNRDAIIGRRVGYFSGIVLEAEDLSILEEFLIRSQRHRR